MLQKKKIFQIGAIALAVIFFVAYNCIFLPQDQRKVGFGYTDFAVFYTAGACYTGAYGLQTSDLANTKKFKQVIEQVRKHDGGTKYLYPPQSALLLAPFTVVSLKTAAHIWAFFNAGFYIAAFYLCIVFLIKDNPLKYRYSALLAALAISPITYGLFKAGQLNALILFLMVGGMVLMLKNKDVWSGFGMAIAASFKIFPIIFLPYYIFKKRWKSVAAFLGGIFFLLLLALPLLGWGNTIDVMTTTQAEVIAGDVGYIAQSTSLFGSFRMAVQNGTFDFVYPDSETPRKDFVEVLKIIHQMLTVIFGILVLVALYLKRKSKKMHDVVLNYSMLILYILLFSMSIHSQFHMWIIPLIVYLLSFPATKKNAPVLVLGFITLLATQFTKYLFLPDGFTFAGFKLPTFCFLVLLIIILISRFKQLKWLERAE